MKFNLQFCRRWFVACAVILVVVVVMLALGVIPAVKSDTHPGAAPERAARGFWGNIGIGLAAAATLLFGGIPLMRRGWLARSLLVLLGFIVLVAGLALVDATEAFRSHGPHMHTAMVFMACGAVGEIAVGVLVILAAFRRIEGQERVSPREGSLSGR
jgi:hypothetical protein